jgi:hypothetical protein
VGADKIDDPILARRMREARAAATAAFRQRVEWFGTPPAHLLRDVRDSRVKLDMAIGALGSLVKRRTEQRDRAAQWRDSWKHKFKTCHGNLMEVLAKCGVTGKTETRTSDGAGCADNEDGDKMASSRPGERHDGE